MSRWRWPWSRRREDDQVVPEQRWLCAGCGAVTTEVAVKGETWDGGEFLHTQGLCRRCQLGHQC